MKYLMAFHFLVMLAFQAWGQAGNELTVALSSPGKQGKLIVEIHKGPITVKGTSRQDVLVRYKNMGTDDQKITDAGNGLKKISGGFAGLEIAERDNTVYVESESWNKGLEIYVEVPSSFDLNLQGYNQSPISVENVDGTLEIESYNGKIHAMGISGSLVADTYNGEIVATFKKVTPDAAMAFTTYNGKVDVTLPAGIKANFKLKSDMGEIFTGFDMNVTSDGQAPKTVEKEGWKKTYFDGWTTGSVNGGGPEIKANTWHGDIYIRKL